ncbi:DUF2508 family protein [Gorillibacterium massiliense]|uniref:DUF2508 family protein n=1 Tax=Gorillibacterium massiliense TaxID=1280390 RepID=UPI0004B36F4C|nr:DUF2508 family protein [Gorillibacterium massiliense]
MFQRRKQIIMNSLEPDKLELLQEIRQAHMLWETARARFEWGSESGEEVDFSIFALAAAEKKYALLLQQAKRMDWDNTPYWASLEWA